ncbi:Lin1244/Lin1753 domain-containing protein [Larkinella sp. C7]|uniref:Lin1244/Lin1753 domain-containing protein n=1 Tax=Larkinella sp. C7 TaxID=2576607 RepID=UPI0011112867|nr:Lin1244/Lin1753 domain-containing protein [Larkinella sp. C7]
MKYFLHDTNAFQDEKITELYMRYGYEGLGLFYTVLEKLAAQEKPVKTIVLKRQLEVGRRLEKCWSFLEEIGLISSSNGETSNKRLTNYLETFDKKRENTKIRVSQHRENKQDTKDVTRYNRVSNAPNSIVLNSNIIEDVVDDVKTREGENLPVDPQATSPPITPVARPPSSPDELSEILSEHETRLQADSEFVRTTARALGVKDAAGEYDTAKIISMIGRFFAEQTIAQNQRARIWGEAKSHCYNWIRKKIEEQPVTNEQRTYHSANSQSVARSGSPRATKALAITTDDELLDYMQNGQESG